MYGREAYGQPGTLDTVARGGRRAPSSALRPPAVWASCYSQGHRLGAATAARVVLVSVAGGGQGLRVLLLLQLWAPALPGSLSPPGLHGRKTAMASWCVAAWVVGVCV